MYNIGWTSSLPGFVPIALFLRILERSKKPSPNRVKAKFPVQRFLGNENSPPLFATPGRYNSTNRFNNSFFPDAIKNWNVFIPTFQTIPSFTVLKAHLNNLFRPKCKSIFGIHDRSGIRLIYQLRVGLSPLRSHKLRHSFEDTPTDICLCGIETEDIKHFLFSCPLHARQRAKLAVYTITVQYLWV